MPDANDDYKDVQPDQNAKFFGNRDFAFMQRVNKEFINEVVNTPVTYYRVCPDDTATNIYGEAPQGKVYFTPIQIQALLVPQDQQTEQMQAGFDVKQDLEIGFQREELKKHDIYPEEGDLVQWSNLYFEVAGTVDNGLLATRFYFRHGVVLSLNQTRISNIQIVNPDQRGQ
jgi:hypothetical protein